MNIISGIQWYQVGLGKVVDQTLCSHTLKMSENSLWKYVFLREVKAKANILKHMMVVIDFSTNQNNI